MSALNQTFEFFDFEDTLLNAMDLLDMNSSLNISLCISAEGFATYVPYTVITFLQIIVAGISIPLVFYNAVIFYKRKGTIHKNFLIIYMNGFIHFGVHCTAVFIYDIIKQVHYWTYDDSCDLLIVNYACIIFRALCYTSLLGFSLTHVSMSIERALATLYLKKYEKMGCSFGILLTLFMWLVAICSNVYVFFGSMNETLDDTTFICVSVGRNPEYQVMHYIMFFVDGTSTVADLILLHINKKQEESSNMIQLTPLKNNKTHPLEYNLSKRYQVNENFSTMRTIVPVVITHSIIFTLYLFCALLLRFINLTEQYSRVTIYESVFSINTIYVLAIMIVILRAPIGKKKIENKICPKTNESSMYFQMFEKQLK